MQVDEQARNKLTQYLNHKREQDKFYNLASATSKASEDQKSFLIFIADKIVNLISAIKSFHLDLPKVYPVEGSIDIKSLPNLEIGNIGDLEQYIDKLALTLSGLESNIAEFNNLVKESKIPKPNAETSKVSEALLKSINSLKTDLVGLIPPKTEINIPTSFDINKFDQLLESIQELKAGIGLMATQKPISIPKSFSINNLENLSSVMVDMREQLVSGFNLLLKKEVGQVGFPSDPLPVNVLNFKYPAPVTHISLNSLKGPILTTAVLVGATAIPLPATPLQYRRAVVVYNNGANTLYVGGANVTSANGIPVPAGTFGPSLDSGVASIVYGISGSGTLDIRVLETSDYDAGF